MSAKTDYVTRAEFESVLDRLQDLEDAEFMRSIEADPSGRDYLPFEDVRRLLKGEHPLKVWRAHRGLSLSRLAAEAGVKHGYLSEIEACKKPGSVAAYKALARALKVSIDDITPA